MLIRRSKFNVAQRPDRHLDGIKFDSDLELNFYLWLKQRDLARYTIKEPQIELLPAQDLGYLDGTRDKQRGVVFTPDFCIGARFPLRHKIKAGDLRGLPVLILDCKGMILPDFVLRQKMLAHFSGHPVLLVKQTASKFADRRAAVWDAQILPKLKNIIHA